MKGPALDQYFGNTAVNKAVELYNYLSDKTLFDIKDIGVSARVFNYWVSQELTEVPSRALKNKIQFSFIEYVWLKVINDLLSVGYSVKVLKVLKDQLLKEYSTQGIYEKLLQKPEFIDQLQISDNDKKELKNQLKTGDYKKQHNYKFSFLLLLIAESIATRAAVSILVFKDGSFLPYNENKPDYYTREQYERKRYETHTTVSITNILRQFLYESESVFKLPKLKLLDEKEIQLIEIIESGEYKSVTINFKDQKMKSLEMKKEQDVKKRIVDILTESAYQDITIKSHKGTVAKIENTIKLMFDK